MKKSRTLDLLPAGQIAGRKWLLEQGVAEYTLDNAVKSGRFVVLSNGIYARAEMSILWQGIAASLGKVLRHPATVGGLTALELQGYGQYVKLGAGTDVHIYSRVSCPHWLKKVFDDLGGEIRLHWHITTRLWSLGDSDVLATKNWVWREELAPLQISTPERAVLEILFSVPEEISFEHADQIVQGLTQLSPKTLASLLVKCRNVKVKRLFFWLADRYRYPWRSSIDPASFDLGAGKRVLCKGGKLDRTYQITIPPELFMENQYE